MARVKKIGIYAAQGLNVYAIVRRDEDGYFLNDGTGTFVTPAPADPYLAMTEDATLRGLYEVSESRTAWTAGNYTVVFYSRLGGAPAPATDTVLGTIQRAVDQDLVVTPMDERGALNLLRSYEGKALNALGSLLQGQNALGGRLQLLTQALEREGIRI